MRSPQRRWQTGIALCLWGGLWVALASAAQASQVIAGVSFEDDCQLAAQTLRLNGVGVRAKMIIKVYAVGLYAPQPASEPAQLWQRPGPKRIEIVMLRAVSGERLAESLIQGVLDNTPEADRAALRPRLAMLEAGMLGAHEAARGAVIHLDYLPGVGARVSMDGKPLCDDIAGEDFYRALLRIWLGDKPSDPALKSGLLGNRH